MTPLTLVHIVGGSLALGAGAAALAFRKGSARHAQAGRIFLGSMLVLTFTGAVIAAAREAWPTAMIGIFTGYLVITAWWTARRRDGVAGRFEKWALVVALACSLVQVSFGLVALSTPRGWWHGLPAAAMFPYAAFAAIAAAGDLRVILTGKLSPRQRVARHVWRVCLALLIAAASFFFGQQKAFPEEYRGGFLWFVPPLAILGLMIFWLIRIRFPRAFAKLETRPA